MKKILCSMLVILAFAGSAFADQFATTLGGQKIKGGADGPAATASATALVTFSTGVFGLVNYPTPVAKTCTGYLLATRHATGSKNFSTANTSTAIYWKQVSPGTGTAALLASDVGASDVDTTTYAAGKGWTSY
jgi:hypothetical protein